MKVADLISRLQQIPDAARSYGCDMRLAELHFGLDAEMLRNLVESGLPSSMSGGEPRFEYGDLHYLGLRLRSAKTYLWAAARWATTLERLASRPETRASITYVPNLDGADALATPGIVRLPSGEPRTMPLEHGRPAVSVDAVLRGGWPEFPPAGARIVARIGASVSLHLLPEALRGDTELVRRVGLSDCRTAAELLVEECNRADLEARVAGGLLVSTPYSTIHSWAEVRVDGVWVPADPLMLDLMRTFGGLGAERWPLDRSLGPMLINIPSDSHSLVTLGDKVVNVTFITALHDELRPDQPPDAN